MPPAATSPNTTAPTAARCITLKQAAAMLGVSSDSIRGWLRQDRFPRPLAFSKKLLWPLKDIEALMAQRR
jgi:predicted DNA-binding transcriptional regulator AlpA